MTYPNELTNPAQANWPVRVNAALASLRGPALYAPNDLTTTGLTLGYFGGYLGSTSIADGTVGPLAASDTSYIVAHRTTGAVTHATNTTNWDNTATYGRLFEVATGASSITTLKDWRLMSGGILGGGGSGVVVDADDVTYTPTTLADWDGAADPGNVEQALDQLAERVADVEGASFQPLDSDLTTIAGLSATTDNFIQAKSSAWASRTPAQVVADLQGAGLDVDAAGFRGIPQNSQSGNYTTVAADAGKHLIHPSGAGAGDTFTIDSNANVAYELGTAITFVNMATDAVSIAITSDTMRLSSAGTTGTRTLAQYGIATAVKVGTTEWLISGTGLT